MSSAEFVRNPDVNTSVYRWEASGIDELTRQNKLTSLPFWIPNATTRHHQFKLVLLRGLVPSVDPKQDAFGLLLELIPPPPSPVAAAVPSTSSSKSREFPGGCVVTCEVLPLDALEGRSAPPSSDAAAAAQAQQHPSPQRRAAHERTISSSKTAVVDADNAQISFPDFIPADIVANTRYVAGSPKSLTIQITIETGISVPLHQVTTTAYSFFSSLTSSVSQLLGSTTHLVHEGRENLNAILTQAAAMPASGSGGRGQEAGASAAASPSASAAEAEGLDGTAAAVLPPPWELPPEEWRSRPEAWRVLLCERLAALDGTYRHGVEKTLSSDEVGLLAEVGLSEGDLWSLYALFNFDRDVQENLLTAPVLRARRYNLVPAKIKEETFWANYFWKAHCVGQCVTERQVSAVIAALCTPARAIDTDPSSSVEEVLRAIHDAAEVNAVLKDFVDRHEAGESWCTVVAESARHCVAVLQTSTTQRTDLAAHTRQQLSKALSELKATLAQYGNALSSPPSTPGLASAEVSTALEAETHRPAEADAAGAATAVTAVDEAVAATSTPPRVSADASATKAATMEHHHEDNDDEGAADTAASADAAKLTTTAAVDAVLLPEAPAPPSPTAAAPPPAAASSVARSDGARSASRIEFAKMPWEEEEDG